METTTTILGKSGRLVLPAHFRRAMGIEPGDELILALDEGQLRIFTRAEAVRRVQGILKHLAPGQSLVDELIEERRAESARE
ncbi:MAG: hypothetical protein BZY88_04155 [SAR202 cluster bacterium Io17-Chloro-G9]|nr:MAG: hypothetical protein BZY88_04155 [SAR202 cluster bacterium Io17-Chloro-G9]